MIRLDFSLSSTLLSRELIHQHTIEAVKVRTDIVDIIGEHVVLKKRGREYIGICPFHNDNSPSMTVSPLKQFYYCFSCGAGGNAIKFLMEFQHNSFSDVILDLARRYHLPVETITKGNREQITQQVSRREKIYEILELANKWFCHKLYDLEGQRALSYLKNKRKLTVNTINEFRLGYAPESWDGLFQYLSKLTDITIESLEAAGLIVPRKGKRGWCDRFRNRIIIPISNRQGRVIGFGGRTLDNDNPKYLNSPDTEVFHKNKCIFGIDKAYEAIRRENKAIIVEGYFDVISLHNIKINNVVASLGTALNKHQITQLCHYTQDNRIVLNFDTDDAGIYAAQRAINEIEELALEGQIELHILQLLEAKDPDEFIRKYDKGYYVSLVNKAPLWIDWQINQSLKNKDLNNTEQFQQAINFLVPLLGKLSQPTLRSHYLKKIAEQMSKGQVKLALQLEEDLHVQIKNVSKPSHQNLIYENHLQQSGIEEYAEAAILRIYIHCNACRDTIRSELSQSQWKGFMIQIHALIWEFINNVESKYLGISDLNSKDFDDVYSKSLASLDLVKLLWEGLVFKDSPSSERLILLLNPSEVQLATLDQPLLQLRGTIAVLEKQKSLKRCRHLLEAWSNQRLKTLEHCIAILIDQERYQLPGPINMESKIESMFFMLNADTIRFQELYYNERKHISYLDMQRCTGLATEILSSRYSIK